MGERLMLTDEEAISAFETEARELIESLRGLTYMPSKVRRRLAAFLIARMAERILLDGRI